MIKFTFGCHGRDKEENEVLENPVPVLITIRQDGIKSMFSTSVECRYIDGGHSQRCIAANPTNLNPVAGDKVYCPYVTSIGHMKGKRIGKLALINRDY